MCFAAIGIVTSLVGGVVSAMGAMQQGKAQKAQYKAQALYEKRQALMDEIQGGYEAYKVEQKSKQIAGAQEAGFAAAGIEGPAVVETIKSSIAEADMDKQAIRFGAEAKASNRRYQADIYKMQGDIAMQAARINAFSSMISAGTNIMGSFA